MHHLIDDEGRIIMGGACEVSKAAPLIDGHIDEHRSRAASP